MVRFFGGKGEDDANAQKSESQRLGQGRKVGPIRTFVLGLATNEKLRGVGDDRFEEALRATLPKGSKVARVDAAEARDGLRRALAGKDDIRLFEVQVPSGDASEALSTIVEKGLLDQQIDVAYEQTVVVCRATGRRSTLGVTAEPLERQGVRFTIKSDAPEVFVQYPPAEVHRRWLADDDYRAAYGRWRTNRAEDSKPPRWHASWGAPAADESDPPWVRVRMKDGSKDEHAIEFDERMLLRFAFQGAEITIMRFNLKVLVSRLASEYAVYRSLPLSIESLPKEVQDRMNREPERFRPVREPGKFGGQFDLIRQAYEESGGDVFQLEVAPRPTTPAGDAKPGPSENAIVAPPGTTPVAGISRARVPDLPHSLQSGPIARPEGPKPQ